jgi:hypothetical protein
MVNKRLTGWARSLPLRPCSATLTPSRQTRRLETDGTPRRITRDRNAVWSERWCKIRGAPICSADLVLNARNCRVPVQHDASSINLQFGLVGMQDDKKVPRQNCGVVRNVALGGVRGVGAKKQFIGSRKQDFHARSVVRVCALRRLRALGGCGGGPGRHAIAAQDAVRSLTAKGYGFVSHYRGFIDSAAANRFCGCTRIAPPRGLSRSAIRKNASEMTTGNTNRNSSPLRRSP